MQSIDVNSVRKWSQSGNGSRMPSTISTICPHCSEKGIFALEKLQDDPVRLSIAATASCPGCNKSVHFWVVRHEQTPKGERDNPAAIYMYPTLKYYYQSPVFTPDIPEPLQRSFLSAIDAFNTKNYVATAVCARRTIEGIFKYLVSEDKRNTVLAKLIEHAKNDIDLAAPLTSLSHAIRDGGNLGAHFDAEKEPNEIIARQMVELLDYLISYLYVLPHEIRKLEESLGKGA